jgi:SAM-dependent methyltransferase
MEMKRTVWERLRGLPVIKIGDDLKSWDVLRTIEYVEGAYPKTASVLDLGAFSSEVLCALHRAGFESLTGIDLNPRVRGMPYGERIRWDVGNFLQTSYRDGSFDVITSISVIEHGFDGLELLRETSRLLRAGGSLVASFDYWPEKIDTADTKIFGLDWRIFSRAEVEGFVQQAREHGFEPTGGLSLDASERPVKCAGRDYTFAWLALRRR